MLAATLGVFIHFSITRSINDLSAGRAVWEYGLLLAIIATVIPSFLLSAGLKKVGANNVAIISSIGPVSTIIQAHYFLGEEIFLAQIIGTALVVCGIVLLGWREKAL
jgi:drug/metabolite transporter (DMT)-like permease